MIPKESNSKLKGTVLSTFISMLSEHIIQEETKKLLYFSHPPLNGNNRILYLYYSMIVLVLCATLTGYHIMVGRRNPLLPGAIASLG